MRTVFLVETMPRPRTPKSQRNHSVRTVAKMRILNIWAVKPQSYHFHQCLLAPAFVCAPPPRLWRRWSSACSPSLRALVSWRPPAAALGVVGLPLLVRPVFLPFTALTVSLLCGLFASCRSPTAFTCSYRFVSSGLAVPLLIQPEHPRHVAHPLILFPSSCGADVGASVSAFFRSRGECSCRYW